MADHASFGPGDFRQPAEDVLYVRAFSREEIIDSVIEALRDGDWFIAESTCATHGIQWIEVEAEIVKGAAG